MDRYRKGCWPYTVSVLHSVLFVSLLFGAAKSDLPAVIKIGAIFDTNSAELEKAFQSAVETANGDISVLKSSRLEAHPRRIEREDSFHAQKAVCSLLEEGVVAILGPSSSAASALVRSAAEAFHVPHIQTGPDLWPSATENYTISVYPHLPTLGRGYLDLVSAFGWKTYTLIFEDTESILSQQELLKSATNEGVKVTLRQLLPGQPYRKLLKDIGGKGETNLVLDVPIQKMQSVLKDAQDVGLMTEYHNYFIANLDAHTLNLAQFQHGRTNISSFRLVDPSRMGLSGFLSDREPHYRRKPQRHELLKTQTALVGDSVRLISRALHDLSSTQISKNVPYASCQHPRPWLLGYPLINHMKMIQVRGLTGTVKVDPRGQRTEFNVDIVELKREGFTKIGMWNVNAGIRFTQDYSSVYREVLDSLRNSTLRISTILNPPFAMLKPTEDKLVGNDKYEGFCIDLLHEISKMYSFKYEIRLVRDSSYGSVNDKGDWNGMIRELIDREADLAVADLTITYNREEAVDFTMPFMNLGISILYKKPSKKVPRLFSFLAPLSIEVWLYIVAAYVTVSLFLFFLARVSPYEWVKPTQCSASTNVLENHFTLLNSLWFTIGSLMQQGSDISPRALSTRVLAGIWGFFTLIMISSYTANLAAFLTIERMKTPIENAEDLVKQTSIQYGTVESGSTQAFFKDSKVTTYKQMWSVMESASPSVFTKSISDGVERVKKGKYAFLMESTAIEYITQTECDLIQVGGLLDSKGYGIATPTGSPYTVPLSSAILKLQENGVLHALKERWWRQRGAKRCIQEEKKPTGTTSELSLAKVGGVFVLLLAGLGLACVLAIVEFVCKTKSMLNRKRKEELSAR